MTFKLISFFSLFLFCFSGVAQNIVVEPYLQDAGPTQMVVMWETDNGVGSVVEFGSTTLLGASASGVAVTGNGTSQIHTVRLINLTPNTRYFYKAVTGTTSSAIFEFITPALAVDEAATHLIAMSDMQQASGNPTAFNQVVQDGVIRFALDSLNGDLAADLQMVIVPGDLVNNGGNYSEWENTFFDPQHPLFSYVPIYPVLGNHEVNSPSYFKYFSLPLNGTVGYEEHWWYKDHSNMRIIGLNSNSGYQIPEQLMWLDTVLQDAATNPFIDFVFVQLHHPFHSELWPIGNTNYTGQVIPMLEDFSTSSGKPSVHFFGHTHGYSRGNSQEHNHLMVNVATAGGHIDYWGDYAQIDYPEYLTSQDEYGFVYVAVEAGANPQFTLKRYNMGGNNPVLDSIQLDDEVTIKRYNNSPVLPVGLFPALGDTVSPDCVLLKAEDIMDPDNDAHGASQWQIASTCNDFTTPIIDSWKQYMNSYFEVDLQLGDDLTDERVTTLAPNTNYCWRVRYRDKSLAWSDWSTPLSFTTGASQQTPNLLTNTGGENGINDWTVTAGELESLLANECAGITPYAGTYYFAVGALCIDNAYGSAYQDADVTAYASEIDAGVALAKYGGHLSDYNGADIPSFALHFYDGAGGLISGTDTTSFNQPSWTLLQESWAVPSGTRSIRYTIMGTRTAGSDNDSYFDELFLKVNLNGDSCSEYEPVVVLPGIEEQSLLTALSMYPNPVSSTALLNIPNTEGKHLLIKLYDATGKLVSDYHHVHGPSFTFNREDHPRGVYYLLVYENNKAIGYTKFVME